MYLIKISKVHRIPSGRSPWERGSFCQLVRWGCHESAGDACVPGRAPGRVVPAGRGGRRAQPVAASQGGRRPCIPPARDCGTRSPLSALPTPSAGPFLVSLGITCPAENPATHPGCSRGSHLRGKGCQPPEGERMQPWEMISCSYCPPPRIPKKGHSRTRTQEYKSH